MRRIARTDCPWRDLSAEFGRWNTAVKRFRRWVQADTFYGMFKALAENADFEYTMINGTIAKVHRHGQGAKGDLNTGHRALSWWFDEQNLGRDGCFGQPDRLSTFARTGHDLHATVSLIKGLTCGHLLADRALDANWLREALSAAKIIAVIPPRSNRRFPAELDRKS